MFVNAYRLAAEADLLGEARVTASLQDIAGQLHALHELLAAGRPFPRARAHAPVLQRQPYEWQAMEDAG
jgi:hypothetical protein